MAKVFTANATRRIAAAVRRVEQMPRDRAQAAGPRQTIVPYEFRRFEIDEDLAAGGSAEVHHIVYGSTGYRRLDPDNTFTVNDFSGAFSYTASTGSTSPTYGLAFKPHDQENWEVVTLPGGNASIIKCLVNSSTGVAPGSATIPVDTITVLSPSGGSVPNTSTVNNTLGFPCDDDANVLAFYNADSDGWEGIPALAFTAFSPMSSIQATSVTTSSTSPKLQKKTRLFYAIGLSTAESTWSTWHTGTVCT